ncbi:hypothetical protein FRB96_001272 [Tulasnella sp. 330]|nr:hypothetical protein FRB96_001272 [Tulasnella sp. 330]
MTQLLRRYATAAVTPSKRLTTPALPSSLLPVAKSQKKNAVIQANGRSRDPARPFPPRKAHIYAQYTRLITSPKPISHIAPTPTQLSSEATTTASNLTTRPKKIHPPTIVLISHENFTAANFIKVRSELTTATAKLQHSRDRIAAAKEASGAEQRPEARLEATFQVLRPGLFLPVVRKASGNREAKKLKRILKGPIAALVLPGTLDPQLLASLVRIIDRIAPPKPKVEAKAAPERRGPSEDEFEKKAKPTPVPKMEVVGAYVDGKVIYKVGVKELAKLPGLKELQSQIVGLLSSPASNVAGVLGQAAGGSLARTLEGFKKGLETEAAGSSVDGKDVIESSGV